MTVSSSDVNQANEDFVQAVEAFREKYGYGDPKAKAIDPSQGQGVSTRAGDPGDIFQEFVISHLSR